MNAALVCIAKDEDNYIDEWIEYHLKLGFSKIIIYQNNWRYKGKHVSDGRVCLVEFDGIWKQMEAYNHFVQNHHHEFDWAGFLDIDEFIVLKQHKDISSFLQEYEPFQAVALNWSMFGSNGLEFDEEYSLIKRFTKCRKALVKSIKCLVHLKLVQNHAFFSCPHGIDGDNRMVSVDKTHFVNGFLDDNNCAARNIAYINHYYTKTKAEWEQKMFRGWPTPVPPGLPPHYEVALFDINNTPEYNEYEDLTAYNFMYGDNKS